jgi:hypothetical protein
MEQQCPTCGERGVPIVYGMPTEATWAASERGEIAIGGCCLSLSEHRRACLRCGRQWGGLDPADEATAKSFIDGIDPDLRFWTALPEGPVRRPVRFLEGDKQVRGLDGVTISELVVDQVVVGEPALVVVSRLVDGTIEVDDYAEEQEGETSWCPIRRGDVPLFVPTAFSDDPERTAGLIAAYVELASARRRRVFRRCANCNRRTPPEERTASGECHRCAGTAHHRSISWGELPVG